MSEAAEKPKGHGRTAPQSGMEMREDRITQSGLIISLSGENVKSGFGKDVAERPHQEDRR